MRVFRLSLYFFVGLLLGGFLSLSHAGTTVPYRFNGLNVTRDSGVTYLRGTSPAEVAAAGVTVSSNAINATGNWYAGTGALLQAGGVTFNAVLPLSATAASVAVTAVRANPAGLITSAVASYLLSKGIEYVDGEFKKQGASVPATQTGVYNNGGSGYFSTIQAAANSSCAMYQCGSGTPDYYRSPSSIHVTCASPGCNGVVNVISQNPPSCTSGATPVNGQCPGASVTAQDSDWNAARSGQWSDQAMLDLVRLGVPLPTDKAVFSPPYKDVPLSDPYVDPVTNKRMQDMVRVTPQPSQPDTAVVETIRQEVDSNGQPVKVNGSPVPPESEQKDPCDLHPERIGCSGWGDPGDSDVQTQEHNVSITPDGGWGPSNGTCPADLSYTPHNGPVIKLSYQPVCTAAGFLRPIVLGLAWLTSVLTFLGISRRAQG